MKGFVFTEFLEMVETTFSGSVADDIITDCGLSPPDACTATPPEALQEAFGRHLFGRLQVLYPAFFRDTSNALTFLASIEDTIHAEVRKLYPDAELPTLDAAFTGPRQLTLIYRSPRPLAPLCRGLIGACCEDFEGDYTITSEDRSVGGLSEVHFTITRT